MAKFMGIDFAGRMHKTFAGRVKSLSLIKVAYGSRTSPSAGKAQTATTYDAKGFTEVFATELLEGSLIEKDDRQISIFSKSLPDGIEPATDDQIVFDSIPYKILRVNFDPSGAIFTCWGRGA